MDCYAAARGSIPGGYGELKAMKTHGFNPCIVVRAYPIDIPSIKKLQNILIIDKLLS